MDWAKRPADETPEMVQRTIRDDDGRRWTGSVRSGVLRGGEQHAQVIFVCDDAPSEPKRVARLDIPAAEADDGWRDMSEERVREVFRDSYVV